MGQKVLASASEKFITAVTTAVFCVRRSERRSSRYDSWAYPTAGPSRSRKANADIRRTVRSSFDGKQRAAPNPVTTKERGETRHHSGSNLASQGRAPRSADPGHNGPRILDATSVRCDQRTQPTCGAFRKPGTP